jgi:hypothetical protein
MDFFFFLFFSSPAGPPTPSALASQPLGPRVPLVYFAEDVFSLIHAFRSRRLLSPPSLTHGPRLSALSSTPRRPTSIAPPPSSTTSGLSAPPLHTSRCRPEPLLAPPSLPPPSSSRAVTHRDEPIYSAIEATPPHLPPLVGRYPAFTAPTPLPRPYKSHPDDPRRIPHHSPSLSPPVPHRNTPPPSTNRRRSSLSTAPPFPHLPSSEEPTNVLTAASSTSPAPSLRP